MVNKANMRLVVAALRSGKYPQGTGRLKEVDVSGKAIGYCCMGVMCEVAIEHGVPVQVNRYALGSETRKAETFDGSPSFLRRNVANWLGLDTDVELDVDLTVGVDGNQLISASYVNDELKWPFERIADSMEDYYKLAEDDDEPVAVD